MISPILPIRIAQAVLSVIELGLAADVVSDFHGFGSPSELNFLVFCCVWTWLALVYLLVVPQFFPFLHHQYAVLAVEAVTTLFWFAGWVAWAADLGNAGFYFDHCNLTFCGVAKAAAVFGAFMWLLFVASLVLVCRAVWIQRRDGAADAPNPAAAFSSNIHNGAPAPSHQHDVENVGFNPSTTPAPYAGTPSPYAANSNAQFGQQQPAQFHQGTAEMPQYGGSDYSGAR